MVALVSHPSLWWSCLRSPSFVCNRKGIRPLGSLSLIPCWRVAFPCFSISTRILATPGTCPRTRVSTLFSSPRITFGLAFWVWSRCCGGSLPRRFSKCGRPSWSSFPTWCMQILVAFPRLRNIPTLLALPWRYCLYFKAMQLIHFIASDFVSVGRLIVLVSSVVSDLCAHDENLFWILLDVAKRIQNQTQLVLWF